MIPKPSPSPSNPIHIYRALLRECTYLPDPAARTYWHARTVARFREYNPRTNTPWWLLPKNRTIKAVDPARRIKLLHTARKYLSLLARANVGVSSCLETVLAHTYGRTGKRRHELLKALEEKGGPVLRDEEAVKKLSAALAETPYAAPQPTTPSAAPTLAAFRASPLSAPLQALLRAQRAQPLPTGRTAINSAGPQIPALNSWLRPFPIRRARNVQRRWGKAAEESLLPPLPVHEFARLQDLAAGREGWEGVARRRGRGMVEGGGEGMGEGGGQAEAEAEGERHKRGKNPHHLTPRYMRRHWSRILTQCSTMHFDTVSNTWKVQWGRDLRGDELKRVDGLGGQEWMFEGVDERGKKLGGLQREDGKGRERR